MPSSEYTCIPCNRTFGSADAIYQHRRDAPNHHFCKQCDKYYETAQALQNHMLDSHYLCRLCSQGFWTKDALMAHFRDSKRHNYCVPCGMDFKYASGLKKHQKSYFRHQFCSFCTKGFKDASCLEEHHRAEHFVCSADVCQKVLDTFNDGLKHVVESHPYCNECEELRVFRTENDLVQHLASVHGKSTIACQITGCGKEFKLWGSLMQHYNSGGCPSGLTGPQLTNFIIRLFKTNAIPALGPVLLPSGGTTLPATSVKFNGSGFESFWKLKGHARVAPLFRCPRCARQFPSSGDLMQHAESRKCGENTFEKVKKPFAMLNASCIESASILE